MKMIKVERLVTLIFKKIMMKNKNFLELIMTLLMLQFSINNKTSKLNPLTLILKLKRKKQLRLRLMLLLP